MSAPRREIVGLIPAAGRATRIAPLPCSKELYPIGFRLADDGQSVRPKPVGQYLLEHFRGGGAERALIIVRKGKWDIPEYFGDGSALGLSLGYLIMNLPHGAPYTLDQAYPFVRDATVLFGFPDILFEPDDAFPRLVARLDATGADVVLGLFPTDQPHLADPVVFDDQGRIRDILVKPPQSDLRFTWVVAAWAPSFTQFLHEYLARLEAEAARDPDARRRELYMSHVLVAAISAGLRVEGLHLPGAHFLDIGVPHNLVRALRHQLAAIESPPL
ncbi:MAG: dTDP-glucose pyrophosphorylase [Chloroflexales bacterium]|nr:dTDP-glucose pyrophosphorylase [Chloroflexales bacterium]